MTRIESLRALQDAVKAGDRRFPLTDKGRRMLHGDEK